MRLDSRVDQRRIRARHVSRPPEFAVVGRTTRRHAARRCLYEGTQQADGTPSHSTRKAIAGRSNMCAVAPRATRHGAAHLVACPTKKPPWRQSGFVLFVFFPYRSKVRTIKKTAKPFY